MGAVLFLDYGTVQSAVDGTTPKLVGLSRVIVLSERARASRHGNYQEEETLEATHGWQRDFGTEISSDRV